MIDPRDHGRTHSNESITEDVQDLAAEAAAGYDVDYREFDGGHTIPADIAREGMRWAADA